MINDNNILILFKNLLQQNTDKMVEELRIISDFKHHPETELLEFEIHDIFNFILYPMTIDANQVVDNQSGQNYFISCYKVPLDLYSQLKRLDIYSDVLYENYDKTLKILIEWFSDCWDKIKSSVILPTYIMPHDSNILFDLRNKRWAKMGDQYNFIKSFKIGTTEFLTGDVQFSIEKNLLSLEVNGSKDVFDKLTEDDDSEWSWALYPPKFYLYNIPYEDKKIVIDEDFKYKYDVSLYMMEHNDFIGTLEITAKSIYIQGQVDIMGNVLPLSIMLER